jgi:hypothetical protein
MKRGLSTMKNIITKPGSDDTFRKVSPLFTQVILIPYSSSFSQACASSRAAITDFFATTETHFPLLAFAS